MRKMRRMTTPEFAAVCLLFFSAGIYSVAANTDRAVFEMLMKNYNPKEAPNRYGSRSQYVPVEVRAMVEAMQVEESASTVQLQLLQRLSWTDVRLRHRSAPAAGGIVVSEATAGYPSSPLIWLPVLVYPRSLLVQFDNSIDSSFKIRPNGTVTWQQRVRLRIPCKLNLQHFPWDANTCRSSIRQNLDHDVLMLNWTENAYQPLYAGPYFNMDGYSLTSLTTGSHFSDMETEHGSSLRSKALTMRFEFTRMAGYYVVNDLIPTSVLVICCYTAFWLPPESVMVRTLICSFMLLANFIVTAMATRAAPLTTYLSALHLWNGVCLFLVLWATLQSLVVYRMSLRIGNKEKGEEKVEEPPDPPKSPETNDTGEAPEPSTDVLPPPPPTEELGPLPPRPSRRRPSLTCSPRLVDIVSRVLYPITFCVLVATFGALYGS